MKYSFFVLSIFVSSLALSNPISPSDARHKAETLLSVLKGKRVTMMPASFYMDANGRQGTVSQPHPSFYIFNEAGGEGFVIISGEDCMPEVVGYGTTHSVRESMSLPSGLVDFLQCYDEYVEDIRHGVEAPPLRAGSGLSFGTIVVEPMLTCHWGQQSPYNALCPDRCPVGCVATAMAQVMYYYRWPEHGAGSMTYSYDKTKTLSVDFSQSSYNWEDAEDIVRATSSDGAKQLASRISYDCGVAIQMQYSKDSSGAHEQSAMKALHEFFGYQASTLDLVYRNCLSSQEEWNDILSTELKAGRPVVLSASSRTGEGSDATGHCFVADGLDSNCYLHINWGWNGDYDGFYDIALLDNSKYTFSENQSAIIGIVPNRTGEISTRKQYRLRLSEPPVIGWKSRKLSSSFICRVGGLYNAYPDAHYYTVCVGICDKDGRLLETFDEKDEILQGWYGYETYGNINCKLTGNYADGDYHFRVFCKEKNYDEWMLPYCVSGDESNKIYAYIEGDNIYFNTVSVDLPSLEIGGNAAVKCDYYDIHGRKLKDASSFHGIVIEKRYYSNGIVVTEKRTSIR